MTETTEPTPDVPDITVDTKARPPKLQTFDEMLPAASAFYRR